MRVVTTCTQRNHIDYAHRFEQIEWPTGTEIYWYGEGFDPGRRVEDLHDLADFKEKYRHLVAPSYMFDVVRFSNKVFAVIDAFWDYDGIGVWCDADCVGLQPIPEGYIESLLPAEHFMALFQRKGMYSETGFWIMDCRMPIKRAFLDAWRQWYTTGSFKNLDAWTDCHTLDATIRAATKRVPGFKVHNLSGAYALDTHPMSKVDLARYLDHCKGPRKTAGYSPENPNSLRPAT